jgi:hypothetical protein
VRQRKQRKPEVAKTRGWAALLKLLETKTQLDLEAESKVPQSVISSIATRKSLPGRETIWKLEAIGIKGAWWGEAAAKGKAA